MAKNLVASISILLFILIRVNSQDFDLKLKENKFSLNDNLKLNLSSVTKKADASPFIMSLYVLTVINPMVVFEDKKVFFALTKELSFAKFPYGRISFEYSYIFRDYNTSHLRLSYNYDILLEAGDLAAFIATPGAGYFTDTKSKGWFINGCAGILLATIDYFALYPYLRYRYTYVVDKNKTDIHDVSLGMAFIISF